MKKFVSFFTLAFLCLLFFRESQAQIITFVVPGANNTYITCVNDSNVVGGYYDNATGIHGFTYDGATVTMINFPGASQTYIYGINNHNIVVGAYNNTGALANNEGFSFNPLTSTFTDLTTNWIPSMDYTIARDINDANCIVGDYKQSTTHVCFSMCGGTNNSFHYNYQPTYINCLNNTGRRAGFWIDGANRHGLIYTSGSWAQFDYPGSNKTMFTGLNDSNVAVGIFNLNRSFIYKHGFFREVTKKGATDFQIHDISNKGKIVGYYKDASNTYKGFWMNGWDLNFRPNPNGWQFDNSDANCWPPSWYNQFDYTYDPYLGGNAPFPKIKYQDGHKGIVKPFFFPDWPLFVQLLGEDQCYQTGGGFKVLRSKAFFHYWARLETWGGSCFGFVESSFMAFDSLQRFKAKYPKVGPWTASNKLYDLPINDENRKCINQLYLEQYQSVCNTFDPTVNADTPTETLGKLKKIFLGKSKNVPGLSLFNQAPGGKGGHIVNPYKIMVDTLDPTIEYIYIYDNNWPNDTTRKITVHTDTDCWFYDLATNAGGHSEEWGGWFAHKGTYIDMPVETYFAIIPLDSMAKVANPKQLNDFSPIELYNSPGCDILISNTAGQSIGYQGKQMINNIPGARLIIPKSGTEQPPKGYTVPDNGYDIVMSNFNVALSSLTVFDKQYTYDYYRSDASLDQKDRFVLNAGSFGVNNKDNIAKIISLTSVYEDSGNEMTVEIDSLGQSSNCTSSVQVVDNTRLKLFNSGAATHYNLSMHYGNNAGEARFTHKLIPIAANTAHIISPDWSNLQTANVCIYVDNGNNGTYEDTICFSNNEPPQVLTNPTRINQSPAAAIDTINITNSGGGALNWSAVSSAPSWLSFVISNSGSNTGSVKVAFSNNTGGARKGTITFTALGASNSPYQIRVEQDGLLSAPTNVSASDGNFSDGVHITWSSVIGASLYKIYRSDTAGANGGNISSWISTTSYIDTTASKGKYYYYSIRAAQDSTGLNATDFSTQDAGWRSCFTAAFTFSGDCSGQPTLFKNLSTVHTKATYLWDVNNDGTTDYIGRDITHTYTTPGTYIARLTVTDSSLCTDSQLQSILIKSFPVVSLISDSTVCAGHSVVLNAGSGFGSYLWSNGATTSSITVDSSGQGLGIHGFYVSVTNGNGCSTTAVARITFDTCANAGGYMLAGTLTYDNLASTPLSNTTVLLKQGTNTIYQATTNNLGQYAFTNIAAGVYQLNSSCNKTWGGANSTDALRVSRHFVGLTTLQGLRLVAADVNNSNSVNSIDALLIAKRFVGLINSFAAGDWVSMHDTLTFGNVMSQTVNLKTLTYGDVDGSFTPFAKVSSDINLINKGFILASKGSEIEIPVKINGSKEIGAISLSLNIPRQFVEIKDVTVSSEGTLVYHVVGNELRISWFSLSPFSPGAGETLLSIRCRMNDREELTPASWTINPQSEIADGKAEILPDITLNIPDVVINASQFFLGQNVPNPFAGTSEIAWFMPEAGKVLLRVYDMLGHEVKTLVNGNYQPGAFTATMDAAALAPGTYNYRIEITGKGRTFSQAKSLIIIK